MANPKSKSRRKIIIFSIIGLAIVGLAVAAKLRSKPAILTVQTEKATRRNLTELIVATGKIQPFLQVKISPEVSGEIIALPVKEGQVVKKGDLLVKIKPDLYEANRRSADAQYKSAMAGRDTAAANLAKAEAEFARNDELFKRGLISESLHLDYKTSLQLAKAQTQTAAHQSEMALASLRKVEEDLSKTTIYSPIDGTVSKLISQVGERVVGTAMMAGTDIMTVADLNVMEARVDVGEVDIPLINIGQKARLEVDSFKDRKFAGTVTEIANSAKSSGLGTQQEATKFEVRIRLTDVERYLPGMSVTAEVETRYRSNVVTIPIQCVTTRLPKEAKEAKEAEARKKKDDDAPPPTEAERRKQREAAKAVEVVFTIQDGKAKMLKVKRGISDDNYVEITEGVTEGMEIVSGGFKAISRELEDEKEAKVDNAKKPASGSAAAKP
jgi:HlyD family secretion protein